MISTIRSKGFAPLVPALLQYQRNLSHLFPKHSVCQSTVRHSYEKSYRSPFLIAVIAIGVALKEISIEELDEHTTKETGLWVYWKNPKDGNWYVSAMASFIDSHPGGDKILLAGGKDVMPFYQIFARHLDANGHPKPEVLKELESRIIGRLKEAPSQVTIDPYELEPNRENSLTPLQPKPYNAGQISANLTSFYTPISDLFVRFHTPAPQMRNYSLQIDGKTFSLEDLKQFKQQTFPSVLQCTGHRRAEMTKEGKTDGLQWDMAVGNVSVTGYRLFDLLGETKEKGKYLYVEQLDEKGMQHFSTCIPLHLVPLDTLLLTAINDEPMDRDHGGPIRFFPPGLNGNFAVKRVDRITILTEDQIAIKEEFKPLGDWAAAISASTFLQNYVERRDGQLFFDATVKVNSMVTSTDSKLSGWAWSGGGRFVTRVEISNDNGKTWSEARLQPLPGRYTWRGWEHPLPKPGQILVRATDSAGNVQPLKAPWNPRGLRNNSITKLVL